jgi:hypothetical protein
MSHMSLLEFIHWSDAQGPSLLHLRDGSNRYLAWATRQIMKTGKLTMGDDSIRPVEDFELNLKGQGRIPEDARAAKRQAELEAEDQLFTSNS